MPYERWGASLPMAHDRSAAGVGAAVSSLENLAQIFQQLGATAEAQEARMISQAIAPYGERVAALRATVDALTPTLAAKELSENQRRNRGRLDRQRREDLELFERMVSNTK